MMELFMKLFNPKPLQNTTKQEEQKITKPNMTYFIKQEGKVIKCTSKET